MNGKELFSIIYDDNINEDECIQVLHPQEQNHYLVRDINGEFDKDELFGCLLFKEYTFKIVNQQEAIETLNEIARLNEIERLEKRLKELKNQEEGEE